MTAIFIDRRKNSKGKSAVNRQKVLGRIKRQARDAVKDMIRRGNIKDLLSDDEKDVNVPVKDLSEPNFSFDTGGIWRRVYNGNEKLNQKDRISRPKGGEGKGRGKGSNDPATGQDEFTFRLTKKEFLDIFFSDLALPDLIKQIVASPDFESRRGGVVTDGPMTKLNRWRTIKKAKARGSALKRPNLKTIKSLEEQELELLNEIADRTLQGLNTSIEEDHLEAIQKELAAKRRKRKLVPFIDKPDLQFNLSIKVPVPATNAVMFCVMDTSGSMGEYEKEMAKRFFILLYLFLTTIYDHVKIIFIRHHTKPEEVDEHEFFHGTETGGTIVSPALALMADIVKERFPLTKNNIYLCQASDGDNWDDDNEDVRSTMINQILPIVQYAAYVEIAHEGMNSTVRSQMWNIYESIKSSNPKLNLAYVTGPGDIWPVFSNLFKRKPHEAGQIRKA